MTDIFGEISIEPGSPSKKAHKRPTSKRPQHKRKRPSGQNPFRTILPWMLILAGVLALYSLLGFIGVPYYIKHFIPEQLRLQYQLNFEADRISFNPYSFNLTLDAVSITQNNGTPLVDVNNIDLIVSPMELLRMEFVCQEIRFTSPYLHLQRNIDNSYNITPLLPGKDRDPNKQMMTFSDLPILFSINNIIVTDGTVLFEDKPADKTHTIEKLDLQLPTLSNIGYQVEKYIRPHFSAIINGSPVTFKENDTSNNPEAKSSQTEITWELQDIKLENYINYLPFTLPFDSTVGSIDGTITLRFNNIRQHNIFLVAFDLNIRDFRCNTPKSPLELNSEIIKISGSYNPVKNLTTVDELLLNTPRISSKFTSITELLSYFGEAKSKVNSPIPPPQRLTSFIIRSLSIKNGYLKQVPVDTKVPIVEWGNLTVKIDNYYSNREIKGDGKDKPLIVFSGERKDKSHQFSYSGVFTTPTETRGDVEINRLPAEKLLNHFLSPLHSSAATGLTHLEGQLSLMWNGKDRSFNYHLSDIHSSTKRFSLLHNKKQVLKAEELHLSGSEIDNGASTVGNVIINKGDLKIIRFPDNKLFSKLLTPEKSIHSLVFDGDITVASLSSKNTFVLKGVNLSYQQPDDSTTTGKPLTLTGTSRSGGTLKASGDVKFNPLTIDLTIDFQNILSKETKGFLPQPNFITNSNGIVSGSGKITVPKTDFSGNLKITDGKLTDTNLSLAWNSCTFEHISFTSNPYHRTIGRINLHQPKIETAVQSNNQSIPGQLIEYFRKSLKGQQKENTQQNKVHLSGTDIQEITISDGQIDVTDARVSPPWQGSLNTITGTIKDIHSARSAKNATFAIDGAIDGARFSWQASIAPSQNGNTESQQLSIKNYPINKFVTQLSGQTDATPEEATVTLDVASHNDAGITEQEIDAQIHGLKPSSAASESSLPIALMTDKNGVIQLHALSNTPYNAAKLSLFETLLSSFQTKVVKGSLSPLLLAKGDFTDLIDNEYITFKPGRFMLTEQGRQTLTRYGALLVSHPNIKLSLSGGIAFEADRASLHIQLEKDEKIRVEKENDKLFSMWQEKKREFEAKVNTSQQNAMSEGEIYEKDIPSKVLSGFRPLLPEPVIVDDEMLYDLAEERLNIVRKQLRTKLSLDENRIEVVPPMFDTDLDIKTSKGVHVDIHPTW